jgi:hypothetical protein
MGTKRPDHRPDQAIGAGQTARPRNLAKMGVAGSNPVVRSRERRAEQPHLAAPDEVAHPVLAMS